MSRPNIPVPGPARLTLILLVAVPAAMAYPWNTVRERWVLGVAVAVVAVVLAWWRGLHLTTIMARRLAMLRGRRGERFEEPTGTDVRTTAALRITPPIGAPDELPLELIVGYLDRYGIRAEMVRITSHDTVSEGGACRRETWIGLTLSAAANLAALRARSARIPLHETAEVAARRLADHLREHGWDAAGAGRDDIAPPLPPSARETWRGAWDGSAGYVAAYRVNVDEELPDHLGAICGHQTSETWTTLEIAESSTDYTAAVACAFRTGEQPTSVPPLPGLTPQSGNQRAALQAMHPLSTQRLDGHTTMPVDSLAALSWPSAAAPALSTPR